MEMRTTFETMLGRTILPLARRWRSAADRALAEHGLSHASGWVLIHIGRMGDAVPQSELAIEADMQGPSLVRLIDRLEQDGLAVRRADDADRRINRICLTDAGLTLVSRIEGSLQQIRREILSDISDKDLRTTVDILQRIDRTMLDKAQSA